MPNPVTIQKCWEKKVVPKSRLILFGRAYSGSGFTYFTQIEIL